VYTPLGDNPAHTSRLCDLLQLGASRGRPARLSGGFHHLVWRLETARGTYVVKQLAPDTDLGNPATAAHFNATERVAASFAACGIDAIHALPVDNVYLHVLDEVSYLVYPWTDAIALEKGIVSETHALKVARLLAKMHLADIKSPEIAAEEQEPVTEGEVENLVHLAMKHGVENSQEIKKRLPQFKCICAARADAVVILGQRQVVSHGDLDQKNVLWSDKDSPVLIDWEAARMLNPTREVLEEALDWSGFLSSFDEAVFGKFIREYQLAGGIMERGEIDAALDAVLGGWLDWLAYNVGRGINMEEEQQRALGNRQVALALSSITLLERLAPKLSAILEDKNLSPH
jgi:aminoglycoside phosphotransferase (APT) family kinase protein